MSRFYDKDKLKEALTLECIFDLLELWGAEPEYISGGIVGQTICHNEPGAGSRKLYYYENTELCKCYTQCSGESSFDIFELAIKVAKIQKGQTWELYDAMDYIAGYFGFEGEEQRDEQQELEDWGVFKRHEFMYQGIEVPVLKEYNPIILTRFSYPRISHWEKEGISAEVCKKNLIGYYAGGEKITIPHFDRNNRLIGIRGRTLSQYEGDRFGKYRPLVVNKASYAHPLSVNLYHIQRVSKNISKIKTAIIFESEKSTLMYETYFGNKNDISVACCGSSISLFQIKLLRDLGVTEVIIAFDKDYDNIGDQIFQQEKKKLLNIYNKYHNIVNISFIFDKQNILPTKSSPIDQGPDIFENLMKRRIFL